MRHLSLQATGLNLHQKAAPLWRHFAKRAVTYCVGRKSTIPLAKPIGTAMGHKLRSFAAMACLSLFAATPGYAVPVDFNFTLTDGTNTITGLIEGLDSDGANQAADRVTVFGLFDTFVFDATDLGLNSFTVSAGVLDTSNMFLDDATNNGIAGENDPNSRGRLTLSAIPLLVPNYEWVEVRNGSTTDVQAHSISVSPVAAVPLPAGGVLLVCGVIGIAGLKRRKKPAG